MRPLDEPCCKAQHGALKCRDSQLLVAPRLHGLVSIGGNARAITGAERVSQGRCDPLAVLQNIVQRVSVAVLLRPSQSRQRLRLMPPRACMQKGQE